MAIHYTTGFLVFAATFLVAASPTVDAEELDLFGGRALKPGEKHDGKTMTVDELVFCIDLQRELRDKASSADSHEMDADLIQSRNRGLLQIIDAERRLLDTSDQRAIDAFNAKVAEHSAAVDSYNTVVVSLNEALSDQDDLSKRFNAQCTTSVYDASDLTKAYSVRERRLAASMAEKSAKPTNKP